MARDQQKASVTVRIGGEDHIIRANVEPEYTRRCAKWVDDRISEIRSQLGLIESHKVAILAALSITDELFQAQGEAKALRKETARRAGTLARKLELALGEEESGPPPETEPEGTGG
jgi:cell division protein ZapA